MIASAPRIANEVAASRPAHPESAIAELAQRELEVLADSTLYAGRYRLDSVLGNGGMGMVYAATHAELRVPVAIKVIHPNLAHSTEARARFCIEARAGAALRSPHTLRVYDAGQLGTHECFVVMERLEGINLDELVRVSGPLRVETAVDYVLQACAGLAEAHAIGLVHRDIKPENLFLAHYRCAAPLIKVMDFGIARWQGDELRNGRLTNPTSNLGSPCYQSPEQMENATDVDERSDIWSLGLVLFELLTGQCPFEAETIQETCWRVLQGPRPSLLQTRPDVPEGLDAVVVRCLQLDRQQRYSSVKQLALALRPFASKAAPVSTSRSVTAPRAAPIKRLPTVSLGRPAVVASAAFLAGVVAMAALQLATPQLSGVGDAVRNTSSAAFGHASTVVQTLIPQTTTATTR
jgi:eukaryotic-like serine/threonine-protein kinase